MVKVRTQGGMTLVEVIVSMAIIAIFAGVFLPLFTSSLVWVFAAGDKGEAYSMAQKDIERRLATGESIFSEPLVISFPNSPNPIIVQVRGGLVETNQPAGQRSSRIEAFVPLVPTMRINPIVRPEGSADASILITGFGTTFDTSTRVELFNKSGTNKIGSTITPTVNNQTSLTFLLPANLINADYIIRVTTIKQSPSQNEIVRARYTVEQAKYVAVGRSSVFISADGNHWVERSGYNGIPAGVNLNAVINNGRRFVAVGENGLVLVSSEQAPWVSFSIATENLLGVTWSPAFARFFAVGDKGGIYSSSDVPTLFAGSTVLSPASWQAISLGANNRLNDITSTTFISGNSLLTAVGDGIILASHGNGSPWLQVTVPNPSFGMLNAVVSGPISDTEHHIVAVGDNGAVFVSSDGVYWVAGEILTDNLTDVTFSHGQFVTVTNGGEIFTSANGMTWIRRHTSDEILHGVHALGNVIVSVGNNGTVVYSSDNGVSWSTASAGVHQLTGIAGR